MKTFRTIIIRLARVLLAVSPLRSLFVFWQLAPVIITTSIWIIGYGYGRGYGYMDVKNADEMFDIIDLITLGEEPVVFDEEFGTLTASLIGNCLNYISVGY